MGSDCISSCVDPGIRKDVIQSLYIKRQGGQMCKCNLIVPFSGLGRANSEKEDFLITTMVGGLDLI